MGRSLCLSLNFIWIRASHLFLLIQIWSAFECLSAFHLLEHIGCDSVINTRLIYGSVNDFMVGDVVWLDWLLLLIASIDRDQMIQMRLNVGSHALIFFVTSFILLFWRNYIKLLSLLLLFDRRVFETLDKGLLAGQGAVLLASLVRCAWVEIVCVWLGSGTAADLSRGHDLSWLHLVCHNNDWLQLLPSPDKFLLVSHWVREVLRVSRVDKDKHVFESSQFQCS